MLKIMLSLCLGFSAPLAFAGDMTLNQIFVLKDTHSSIGLPYKGQTSVKQYCSGLGTPVNFGSFRAAQTAEGLNDGFYTCTGEFVRQPGRNSIDVFKIDGCVSQNPEDINCPVEP